MYLKASGWKAAWAWGFTLVVGLRVGLGLMMGATWFALREHLAPLAAGRREVFAGLPVAASQFGEWVVSVWVRWDAVHLLNLARLGYSQAPPGDSVYYPLYPLVTRAASALTGGDTALAGLLVSTLAAVVTLAALFRLAEREFGAEAARWSVLALAVYPTAFFLIAPFTEALFMALTLGAFLLAYERRWLAAGALGALAALTRGLGLWAVFGLAWIAWRQWRAMNCAKVPVILSERRISLSDFLRRYAPQNGKQLREALPMLLGLALIPLGGLSFWLWRQWAGFNLSVPASLQTYSSGLVFLDPVRGLWLAFGQWLAVRNLQTTLDFGSAVAFIALGVVMALTPRWRRGEWILFMGANLAFMTSIHASQASYLQSVARYVLMLFPAFIVLGDWLARRGPRVRFAYFTLSSILLLVFSALYTAFWFIG